MVIWPVANNIDMAKPTINFFISWLGLNLRKRILFGGFGASEDEKGKDMGQEINSIQRFEGIFKLLTSLEVARDSRMELPALLILQFVEDGIFYEFLSHGWHRIECVYIIKVATH